MTPLTCIKPQSRTTGVHVECECISQTVAHLVDPTMRTAGHSATSHPKRTCLDSSPARLTDVYLHNYIKKVKLHCIQYCLILSHFRFKLLSNPSRSKSFVTPSRRSLGKALGWGSRQTLAKYAIHDARIQAQLFEEI